MRHDMIRHIMTTIRYTMIHNTSMARCNVMRYTPRENRSPYERVLSLRRGHGRLCVVAVISDHGCRIRFHSLETQLPTTALRDCASFELTASDSNAFVFHTIKSKNQTSLCGGLPSFLDGIFIHVYKKTDENRF